MIASNDGKALAAAFVKTTWAKYSGVVGDNVDTTNEANARDEVLVVKVYGSFIPNVSVPLGMTPPRESVLLAVYDLRTSASVADSAFNGKPDDVPGSSTSATKSGTGYADLRLMGTPHVLSV